MSTEGIVKQVCSGLLAGGVIGVLAGRGQYFLSSLGFVSIGLIDAAYHRDYLSAHVTHLTYDESRTRRRLRARFSDLQRDIQRELREPDDDFDQELRWLWYDIRRHIDTHVYYGMGFTIAFLTGVALLSKRR